MRKLVCVLMIVAALCSLAGVAAAGGGGDAGIMWEKPIESA